MTYATTLALLGLTNIAVALWNWHNWCNLHRTASLVAASFNAFAGVACLVAIPFAA